MTETKPIYAPLPPTPRQQIAELNKIAKRALHHNAAGSNEILQRAIRAVEIHTSRELRNTDE